MPKYGVQGKKSKIIQSDIMEVVSHMSYLNQQEAEQREEFLIFTYLLSRRMDCEVTVVHQ
jgi:hypothetical protein